MKKISFLLFAVLSFSIMSFSAPALAADLNLSGTLLGRYYSDGSITADSNSVVEADSSATLVAQSGVVLGPDFRVEAGGIFLAKIGDYQADTDGDQLPDWWESTFFGNLMEDRNGDYDNDGASNYLEYAFGSDPTDESDLPPSGSSYEDADYGFLQDEAEGGGGLFAGGIRLLNGNVIEAREDLSFSSPHSFGLSFEAYYNSRSTVVGSLGHGWSHTYEVTLTPSVPMGYVSLLKIVDATGRASYLEKRAEDSYEGAFGELTTVKAEGGGYVWYRLDGARYGFSSAGRLEWIDDEKGNRLSLSYNGQGRLETVTDTASGRVLTFNYLANGLLENIHGPVIPDMVSDGIWVSYGYDINQNLTSVTYADASGYNYLYEDPNDIHNLTEKQDISEHTLNTWGYDASDRVETSFTIDGKGVSIVRKRVTEMQGTPCAPYASSNAVSWRYDERMRLSRVQYGGGTVNEYQDYDERGNARTVKLAVGSAEERVITYTFHPEINVPLTRTEASVLQAGGYKVTIWDYDNDYDDQENENPTGLLSRIVEQGYTTDSTDTIVPYEYVTTLTYNSKGQPTSVDGPLTGAADTTSFSYDDPGTGNLLSVTRPIVGTTGFDLYDDAGQVGRVTDVNGQTELFAYDGRGRLNGITHNADGGIKSIIYSAGLLDSITDEDGVKKTYSYDPTYGRLDRITDLDGNYILHTYDSQGNLVERGKYDSSDSRTSRKRWDYQQPNYPGKLWKVIKPDDTFTDYDYHDSCMVASVTDNNGQTTSYLYDSLNRLKTVTQPGSIQTSFTYDGHGNLETVVDPEGHTTSYTHDDMGRLVSTTSPDTGTVTFVYDAAGNVSQRKDAREVTVSFSHDLLNRLTGIDFPGDDEDMSFSYDQGTNGKGHRSGMTDPSGSTTFAYDSRGRLTGKTVTVDAVQYVLSRSFTRAGRLDSISYPSGRTVDYERYVNSGKIEKVTTTYASATTTLVDALSYKPFGKPVGMTTGAGGTVDNVSQDCDCLETANPGAWREKVYTYDGNGNLTSIKATNIPAYNEDFHYDALNRLATATGPYGTISYGYDKAGNRTSRTVNGQQETYVYVAGTNRIDEITGAAAISFGYDANGNVTAMGDKSFAYNYSNRLVQVQQASVTVGEYVYNGLGQRVSKTVDSGTTVFHYDFDGNIIGESLTDGTFVIEYLYLGGSRTAMVDVGSGEIYYYQNNHLGTPQLMTDESNTVVWEAKYKPFGEAEVHPSSSVENNFRFPGQYYDEETDLHYNYHRYYDPQTGRYLTPDPIGLAGGINLYPYVDNDPINASDPLGLTPTCEISCVLKGTGAIFIETHLTTAINAAVSWVGYKIPMSLAMNVTATAAVTGISGGRTYIGAEKLAHKISDPITECVNECREKDYKDYIDSLSDSFWGSGTTCGE